MAVELAPLGITVNAICPGLTATDMLQKSYTPELLQQFTEGVPMKRAADPREVASVITFLSSPEASYVTGQLLAIDGGSTAA